MRFIAVFGSLVTVVMGLVVFVAARRWASLDSGARWITVGIGVFFAWALISVSAIALGARTRVVQEIPSLLGTVLFLRGFADWQPKARQRRIVLWGLALFVVLWVIAQILQGLSDQFSTVSGPIHAMMVTAAAGFTLINRVQVTDDRWTAQLWFWVSIGFMLDYGTLTVLDPLWENIFGLRNDLVLAAYVFHLVFSLFGYVLLLRGFSGVPSPRQPTTVSR